MEFTKIKRLLRPCCLSLALCLTPLMFTPHRALAIHNEKYEEEIIEAAPTLPVYTEELSIPIISRWNDIRLLAMACTEEAQTESEFGKMLVIATVINRVERNNSTVLRELSRPHQFPWFRRSARVSDECLDLARRYVFEHEYTQVTHFHNRSVRPN